MVAQSIYCRKICMFLKGRRIGLEKIVADHAREMEAKSVFPRERPVLETRDVLFLYAPEGKVTHGVRHDFQLPASPGSLGSLVFLQLDPGFFDNRLCQFNSPRLPILWQRRGAQAEASPRDPSSP
jgi:hypothetical protein